jgi:hypothetical protein
MIGGVEVKPGRDGVWRSEGFAGTIHKNGFYEGSGVVDGHPWYLHARGWRWVVAIAGPNEDPVEVVFGTVPGYYHEEPHGSPEEMSLKEAWACVTRCMVEFRAVGFNVEAGEVHDPVLRAFAGIER